MPTDSFGATWTDVESPRLEVGAQARVHTNDGRRHEGEIVRFSNAEVVLGKVGNRGFEETSFAAADIVKVEVFEPSTFEEVVGGLAGLTMFVTFGALLAVAIWLATSGDSFFGY